MTGSMSGIKNPVIIAENAISWNTTKALEKVDDKGDPKEGGE